jgi:hypothetical protein
MSSRWRDNIGISFAAMFAEHPAASDWRDAESRLLHAEEDLREFTGREFDKLLAARECGNPCEELNRQWSSLNEEVRIARTKLKEARTKFLLDPGHRVTAILPREIDVIEVPPSILRTMASFDPEKGTMSDAEGVRQFECIEFAPVQQATDESSMGTGKGRKPEYLWKRIFDEFLAFCVRQGCFPENMKTLYEQMRDAAKVVDPNSKNVLEGGPDRSPIENYLKNFPKFRAAFKEI